MRSSSWAHTADEQVTTTDLAHVPGAEEDDVVRLRVEGGAVVAEAVL